ncbi:hypothetical protein [Paenibacillus sp. GCM10027626]|uniref:hypothetical protein n=1 Tax=Paenibacillus sp. GCM10027626 TaxID=3273411 RepID=UPI00363BDEF8
MMEDEGISPGQIRALMCDNPAAFLDNAFECKRKGIPVFGDLLTTRVERKKLKIGLINGSEPERNTSQQFCGRRRERDANRQRQESDDQNGCGQIAINRSGLEPGHA